MNKCDILARALLLAQGFKYRKRGWYRSTVDFVQIINFQKSSWGDVYYVNIGENFLLNQSSSKKEYPPEYAFRLRGRANRLNIKEELFDCLDFEKPLAIEERERDFCLILMECIAFLDRISTLNGARQEYIQSSIFKGFSIQPDFLSLLWKGSIPGIDSKDGIV